MSPTTEKTRSPGVDETRPSGMTDRPVRAPDDMDRDMVQMSPAEALEDEEDNPWRNHEDDKHKWLGLLLAAVGFGAVGYLIGGI